MSTEEDDVTLTNILNQTKQVEKDYDEYISITDAILNGRNPSSEGADDGITGIEEVLKELDVLIRKTSDPADKNELLQYKSSLYQIRSQLKTEMKDMKTELKGNKQISSATEKAIKWNIGDIF